MFDEVVVAVGINQDKRGFFSMDQRLDIIRQITHGMEGVTIIKYDNLTIDTCRELGIRHIVRGVRNMLDFENERAIADANRRLAPDIETIIIPSPQEFAPHLFFRGEGYHQTPWGHFTFPAGRYNTSRTQCLRR